LKLPGNATVPAETARSEASPSWERYVPVGCWVIVILTLLFISLKIISHGYLPGGDLRRHIAKAFTDKPYTEIVVMRPGYTADHSPGWEWLLRQLHLKAGFNYEALVNFAIVSLLLCVFFAPLPWMRRPEAWLMALLGILLARPTLIGNRLTQGRPLLLTEAILIAVLLAWSKPDTDKPSRLKIALTCLGFSLSVSMHGAWYLWVLLPVAFFLAKAWSRGLWLSACWIAGTCLGALLTGKPIELLKTAVSTAASIYREHPPQWMLVGELAPDTGDLAVLMLLAIVFLLRRSDKAESGFSYAPVVSMMTLGWILGFKADRFWADWGLPAAMVWVAIQLQEFLSHRMGAHSVRRLFITGLVALPLFLSSTNDTNRRYTTNLTTPFLDAKAPHLQGWFPEGNGIFYSVEMGLFYDTFYMNPRAEWRYILGFEPALMPEEDLKIFRTIVWNQEAFRTFQLWIDKMKPEDRLIIYTTTAPNLPQLEWINANQYIWIGRLPKDRAR
jgi:hypothetical protein